MLNKLWNSKAMNIFGEVGYEVLVGAGSITKMILESVSDTIKNDNTKEKEVSNKSTYEYWMSLTYDEQKEYFERNKYLNIYTNDFYQNDRELTAQHMQYIADKMNREFVDKYDRY